MHTRDGGYTPSVLYTEEQVRRALRASGVRVESEIASHFIVYCEFHSNHSTPAAEVDKQTGQFYCFSCHSTTDLPHLIMKRGYSYFQAVRMIGDNDYNIVAEVDRIFNESDEPAEFDAAIVDRLHADIGGAGRDYFHTRLITDRSIDRFQLGYSAKQGMVTVPVHSPTGVLWGFVGRSLEGKRFKNSRGLSKAKTLFNLHRVWTAPRVYVVESSFDAIRLDQVNAPAVATLGAGISKDQIDLLRRTFDEVIVIPDGDAAGEGMVGKMRSKIPDLLTLDLGDAKDVGELSDADLTTVLEGGMV